jgi:sugar phosphate isomerase/epimerase
MITKMTNFMIIRSIAMAIALVVTLSSFAQPQSYVPDPAVVSYTFRNEFAKDLPGTLDMIKDMGINNIEFSNLFGYSAADLKSELDQRGMVCTSYGVGYDILKNNIDEVVANAKTLGAKYVRVAWIPHSGEFTVDVAQRAADDFNAAGKILSENGIYFCYHNHGFEFRPYGEGTLFDYLVEKTNGDYVSFEIDLLWTVHPGADPVALLEKYPERFRLMHLKDLKKGVVGNFSGGTAKENDVVLGTGQVDFPAVFKAARKTNIEYYYIEDESPDVITRVPQSREFIIGVKR